MPAAVAGHWNSALASSPARTRRSMSPPSNRGAAAPRSPGRLLPGRCLGAVSPRSSSRQCSPRIGVVPSLAAIARSQGVRPQQPQVTVAPARAAVQTAAVSTAGSAVLRQRLQGMVDDSHQRWPSRRAHPNHVSMDAASWAFNRAQSSGSSSSVPVSPVAAAGRTVRNPPASSMPQAYRDGYPSLSSSPLLADRLASPGRSYPASSEWSWAALQVPDTAANGDQVAAAVSSTAAATLPTASPGQTSRLWEPSASNPPQHEETVEGGRAEQLRQTMSLATPTTEEAQENLLMEYGMLEAADDFGAEESSCAICLGSDPSDVVEISCGNKHRFHKSCITTWMVASLSANAGGGPRCPLCRRRLSIQESADPQANMRRDVLDLSLQELSAVERLLAEVRFAVLEQRVVIATTPNQDGVTNSRGLDDVQSRSRAPPWSQLRAAQRRTVMLEDRVAELRSAVYELQSRLSLL